MTTGIYVAFKNNPNFLLICGGNYMIDGDKRTFAFNTFYMAFGFFDNYGDFIFAHELQEEQIKFVGY